MRWTLRCDSRGKAHAHRCTVRWCYLRYRRPCVCRCCCRQPAMGHWVYGCRRQSTVIVGWKRHWKLAGRHRVCRSMHESVSRVSGVTWPTQVGECVRRRLSSPGPGAAVRRVVRWFVAGTRHRTLGVRCRMCSNVASSSAEG